jgi:hypothetical protein
VHLGSLLFGGFHWGGGAEQVGRGVALFNAHYLVTRLLLGFATQQL